MSSYWTAFPGLSPPHNPAAPLQAEFARLAEHCGWDDDTRKAQWKICARAEFEHYFAGAQSELAGWHAMCDLVGVEAPTSIKRCREMFRTEVFVNIVDLMDGRRMGTSVRTHASAKALRSYSKRTKKIFPKENAKKNPFLKVLLIEMMLYRRE
ncbi:hypothetical protein B0H13DRAFT_2402755 [Mycena leptocephala]|nr:hypothetical protein B0H13DRAFT_2402755 [Mycena leptocephala]